MIVWSVGLAPRLQPDCHPAAFKGQAVPSTASDVNSASSSFAQPQWSPAPTPAPVADSQPFAALLDATTATSAPITAQANPPQAANPAPIPAGGTSRQSKTSARPATADASSNSAAAQSSGTTSAPPQGGTKSPPPANAGGTSSSAATGGKTHAQSA